MARLMLRLVDGRTEELQLPANSDVRTEATQLVEGKGAYEQEWITLGAERHVRRSAIIEVAIVDDDAPQFLTVE